MSRTNDAAVLALLAPNRDYNTADAPSLQPFIDTASSMVDDLVDCAAERGITLPSVKLELIERWLAAHFYKVSDRPYASKNTEGAGGAFDGKTGMYLESTIYGQTAMRLDPSGCLDAIGGSQRKVADILWLGKPPSAQIPWYDRG